MAPTRPKRVLTHICISDLHAGALASLLTPLNDQLRWRGDAPGGEATASSATTDSFARALGATLDAMGDLVDPDDKPSLVLLGDGPDMAVSPPERSFGVMAGFLGRLYGTRAFSDRLIYIPGNHDHWLWSEQRFADKGFVNSDLRHVTPAFDPAHELGASRSLSTVLGGAGLKGVAAPLYYPNFGLFQTSRDDTPNGNDPSGIAGDNRVVLFHHGHFIESMYRMMSDLLSALSGNPNTAATCSDLEKYNAAWIEFGWSVLGDSGLLGENVTAVYHILLSGGAAATFQKRLAAMLQRRLGSLLGLPETMTVTAGLEMASKALVDALVGKFAQLERFDYTKALSAGSVAGLKSYLSGPVNRQMMEELGTAISRAPAQDDGTGTVEAHTTFIFGHTHKPFFDQLVVDRFARPVSIYNTGGWILDTGLLSTVEGASAVFVDAAGHTAAISLFSPPINGTPSTVRAVSADPDAATKGSLFNALDAAVKVNGKLWEAFSQAVAEDYRQRQKLILSIAEKALAEGEKTGGLA